MTQKAKNNISVSSFPLQFLMFELNKFGLLEGKIIDAQFILKVLQSFA